MRTLTLFVIFAFSLSVSSVHAQETQEELLEDLVSYQDGKMIMEDFALFRLRGQAFETEATQVEVYAESPSEGVISRDNFVSLVSQFSYESLLTIYSEQYQLSASDFIGAIEVEELAEPIGTPDLRIKLVVTSQGIQIEFENTQSGQVSRSTATWEEYFAE
jgi:hypothetical protein